MTLTEQRRNRTRRGRHRKPPALPRRTRIQRPGEGPNARRKGPLTCYLFLHDVQPSARRNGVKSPQCRTCVVAPVVEVGVLAPGGPPPRDIPVTARLSRAFASGRRWLSLVVFECHTEHARNRTSREPLPQAETPERPECADGWPFFPSYNPLEDEPPAAASGWRSRLSAEVKSIALTAAWRTAVFALATELLYHAWVAEGWLVEVIR